MNNPSRHSAVAMSPDLARRTDLGLIEIDLTAIAIPESLKPLEMLDEEAVCDHILPIDCQAILGGVLCPANCIVIAVVSAPDPDVVENHIVGIDGEAILRRTCYRATNTT
jgi:hypothetical protein